MLMEREPPAHQRALLRELAYLFGPEVGPELQTHGYSFAERLAGDEELVAEICKRFEAARSEGRFPVLSALLTETSGEDLEEFFRSGWSHMALPPRESSIRRPWDLSPWDGDLEAYREDLYAGMAFGMHDMRAFAREWLEALLRVGYYGMEESLGLPLKQRPGDFFAPPKPLPLYGSAYPTRIAETGQTIWIRLDGPRSPERGYREISVSDEPLRTYAASPSGIVGRECWRIGTPKRVCADRSASWGTTRPSTTPLCFFVITALASTTSQRKIERTSWRTPAPTPTNSSKRCASLWPSLSMDNYISGDRLRSRWRARILRRRYLGTWTASPTARSVSGSASPCQRTSR